LKPYIIFKKIWSDDDIIELLIEVSDGRSIFVNEVYIGIDALEDLVKKLNVFRIQILGGKYDIKFGEFGHEYANGGFHARLHFYGVGQVLISTYQQSKFEDFSKTQVASEAKMYLRTEPVLLDNFISELKLINIGISDDATLICISGS
jgi:hypothetical protein